MNFLKRLNLFDLGQTFQDTVNRFPASFVCALLCFIIGFIEIFDIGNFPRGMMGNVILVSVIGFFWFGIVQLYKESHSHSKVIANGIAAAGIVFFYLLIFIPDHGEGIRLFSIVASLLLMITATPFILNKSDDLSFWSFNRKFGFGVAVAFIASVILFGGASAALASISYLFEVKISGKAYGLLWLFGATILAPIYALSFVPKNFVETIQECNTPKQVGFMANWILAPLVTVYMAILYAYFIKIGITAEVPKGQLASMITGFILAGIVTYQISWPFVFGGMANKLLRLLMKHFFTLMIVPVLVLFYAIYLRIDQYGFTEQRYIILIAALWFAFLSLGFAFKKLQLKHITISLAILLFFATWGPWGMKNVSYVSQHNRLEKILVKNDLLKDGQIQKIENKNDISIEERGEITEIVRYLMGKHIRYSRDTNGNRKTRKLYGFSTQKQFFDAIGIKPQETYSIKQRQRNIAENRFSFSFQRKNSQVAYLEGEGYYLQSFYLRDGQERSFKIDESKEILLSLKEGNLNIQYPEGTPANLDMSPIIKILLKDNPDQVKSDETLEKAIENEGANIRLEFYSVSGDLGDKPTVTNVSGRAFITLK